VLNVMNKLADDVEPSVRAELMEQVPHIAMYCQEFKAKLAHVVPETLLPMVVKFLTDVNIQVRKTSQAALLVLLEQGLVEKSDVQEQVCPVILRLTEADALDDHRTEAVALLSKMAPLIGKEMSEAIFLERFAALCVDPLFHVRKVCAANFGDFSSVVGPDSTEQVLLSKFLYLCDDAVWGVRKACADVFMPVSCVCSPQIRKKELAPLFVNLLRDQSRWVRMTAYQALGPFISTFADSQITALLHNDNGEIVITDRDLLSDRLDELEQIRAEQKENEVENPSEQQQQQADQSIITPSSSSSPSPKPSSPSSSGTLSSSESTKESVIETESSSIASSSSNHVVEDMDLSHDDVNENNTEAVGASSSTTTTTTTTKLVHSRSEGDLSLEEERAKAYNSKNQENNNNNNTTPQSVAGSSTSGGSLTSSESFNNFLYWRDPVPILEDIPSKSEDMKSKKESEESDQGGDINNDEEKKEDENKAAEASKDTELPDLEGVTVSSEDTITKDANNSEEDQNLLAKTNEAEQSKGTTSETTTSDDTTTSANNDDDDDSADNDQSMWSNCPVITFQTFDDLTDSSDASTMELFRPGTGANDQRTSFSVFDPNDGANNNRSPQQQLQLQQQQHQQQQQQQQSIQDPALPKGPPSTKQSIVPQLLVDHFVSMTDPSRAQTVDSDIAHHCAFSLPAVALTIGRSNWPLLFNTYDILASDMQWKVRRTLASSIHELGVILGQDIVVNDLIPIFNGFLRDLDEVRIGLLKHLADFLKLLPSDLRRDYLPKLSDFLDMDNDRNWRFRQELAEQLGKLVPLFTPKEVKTYLAPIAILLIKDQVAAVRQSAIQVHTIIVKTLLEDNSAAPAAYGLIRVLLADLVDELVRSVLWSHRQTYAFLALKLFDEQALDHAQYAQDVLPSLLDLSYDKVPNVRLAVARVLNQIRQMTYFVKEANPHHGRMEQVIEELSKDDDADVKAFLQIPQMYDSDGEPINDVSSLPV